MIRSLGPAGEREILQEGLSKPRLAAGFWAVQILQQAAAKLPFEVWGNRATGCCTKARSSEADCEINPTHPNSFSSRDVVAPGLSMSLTWFVVPVSQPVRSTFRFEPADSD